MLEGFHVARAPARGRFRVYGVWQPGPDQPATVTINQGTLVNVYVAKDVDFSSVLR